MIEEAQNKAFPSAPEPETGEVLVKAISGSRNEYHFAGSGKWKPVSVMASSAEDAIEEWKKVRQLVEPEQTNNE